MPGDGPFLWLSKTGSPHGFWHVPEGGMCLSAFVFVTRGPDLLLGRYAEDPRWEELTGLDPDRQRRHGGGWTVPATQLRFGEDPREAGARVAGEVLGLPDLRLGEPRVETDTYVRPHHPDTGAHYDVWFFLEGAVDEDLEVEQPPWFAELAWHDPRILPASAYARGHEDVVSRWLGDPKLPPGRGTASSSLQPGVLGGEEP